MPPILNIKLESRLDNLNFERKTNTYNKLGESIMEKQPKVSIITVSFNAEKYIERTIKSVIQQTYPNIEYIIIDGASKDGTMRIVKQYESHIDFFMSEPDKSHFDAMNKGLKKATGDYVLFMNSGDRIHKPTSLQALMEGSNGADLVYSRSEFITEEGVRKPWYKKVPPPEQISVKSFLNGMVICHQCMVVKRSIAPFYKLEPWKVANDIEWAIRVMKKVKTVHFLDAIFCLYLEGGISHKQRIKAVKERFNISVLHFGIVPTLIEHAKIGWNTLKRGRISP